MGLCGFLIYLIYIVQVLASSTFLHMPVKQLITAPDGGGKDKNNRYHQCDIKYSLPSHPFHTEL